MLETSFIRASKKVNFGSKMANLRLKMAKNDKNLHFTIQIWRHSQSIPGYNDHGWSLWGCIRWISMNLHPVRSTFSLSRPKVTEKGLFSAIFGPKLVIFDPKLTCFWSSNRWCPQNGMEMDLKNQNHIAKTPQMVSFVVIDAIEINITTGRFQIFRYSHQHADLGT